MSLDDDTRQQIVDLIYSGQKIAAIKLYREHTGEGLKEAKDFVEVLTGRLQEEDPSRAVPKSQGCGPAVLLVVGVGLVMLWSLA